MGIALAVSSLASARAEAPFSFPTEILPILTHAGCNAGACHGAATGQGGFQLSLLGYDPEADHLRITRDLGARRIDTLHPGQSLLLRKPTLDLDHEGGRRLRPDSAAYQRLRQWVASGAPYGPRDLKVSSIEVEPRESLSPGIDQTFPLRVTARFSDGSNREVTDLALFTSNDDAVADVSRDGRVTTRGSGLTSIMVRYGGQVAASRVAVPFSSKPIDLADFKPANLVDPPIADTWRALGLQPSERATDAEFLRRSTLDLAGRLPTAAEARAFLGQPATPERRAAWVEGLLESDDFVDYWTLKLGDWLLAGGRGAPDAGLRRYHAWLREQVATRAPWDRIVRDLVLASGSLETEGPANYYLVASDPRDLAEQVSSMFLGTQIACARCHAHPSDRWTRDDYHRFAAYFARVGRQGDRIVVAARGEVDDPRTGRPLTPRPLGAEGDNARDGGGEGGEGAGSQDRRAALADWMTASDNPFLARALVNRVWHSLLGRGLVEPVDDLRPTNPPTHPALLEALAEALVAHDYDLRWLVRTVATSAVYQRSSVPRGNNAADTRLYARAYLKPIPAQVFVDAIAQVTGVPDRFDGHPEGTRAVQLIGAQVPSYALDVLGRCARDRRCDPASAGGGGLAQALHLLNGSTIHDKLAGGVIDAWLAGGTSNQAIIEDLYLRAFSRFPRSDERSLWESLLASAPNRRAAVEDLVWVALNARAFAFNP